RLAALVLVLAVGIFAQTTAATDPLPRKAGENARREQVAGADVIYDSLPTRTGFRVRRITTIPRHGEGKLPVLFMVGWLSCDSVEEPMTGDGFIELLHQLASRSGFATVRIDKPGTGDSQGDCSKLDFQNELIAYQDAFAATTSDARFDPQKIFLLGFSNGGGFAPLVAGDYKVRGVIVCSGWS